MATHSSILAWEQRAWLATVHGLAKRVRYVLATKQTKCMQITYLKMFKNCTDHSQKSKDIKKKKEKETKLIKECCKSLDCPNHIWRMSNGVNISALVTTVAHTTTSKVSGLQQPLFTLITDLQFWQGCGGRTPFVPQNVTDMAKLWLKSFPDDGHAWMRAELGLPVMNLAFFPNDLQNVLGLPEYGWVLTKII